MFHDVTQEQCLPLVRMFGRTHFVRSLVFCMIGAFCVLSLARKSIRHRLLASFVLFFISADFHLLDFCTCAFVALRSTSVGRSFRWGSVSRRTLSLLSV